MAPLFFVPRPFWRGPGAPRGMPHASKPRPLHLHPGGKAATPDCVCGVMMDYRHRPGAPGQEWGVEWGWEAIGGAGLPCGYLDPFG